MNNSMLDHHHDNTISPLSNNKVYTLYLPNIILGLSFIYMTTIMIWSIQRYKRQKQSTRRHREKAQLRKQWEHQQKQEPMISCPQQVYTPNSSVTYVQRSVTSSISETEELSLSRYRKKRLDLLWHWSVSMGYCQYEHGYHLDQLIQDLKEKQGF